MMKMRFGLRSKLLLLSGFLFTIPWFGYQYVWEMEKYLRFGQEQTIIGTARALATSLHERPKLFNNQASFLPRVEKGKDLYGYQLKQAIRLDGQSSDWPNYQGKSHYYGAKNQLSSTVKDSSLSLNFTAAVSKYDKYLYFFLRIVDNKVIFRGNNSRSIYLNDHIELAFTDPKGDFKRFIISNKTAGWLTSYQINLLGNNNPLPSTVIQGNWHNTDEGYNVEFRVPLAKISDNIAFAVHDVDNVFGQIISSIGSADPTSKATLGTILVPSPEIERIVKGMSYTNSSIWVVDQHRRVLAKTGDLSKASGLWQKQKKIPTDLQSIVGQIEQHWLKPLYNLVINQPQQDFIDKLYSNQILTGTHIDSALNGLEKSQWRLTTDNKAVVLSAAYPIFAGDKVNGAVIVEETTNGIMTVRNQALEKLFTSILAIMLLGSIAFFFFASRISSRIRTLRNQAELAIDQHGRITSEMRPSNANDEIGDLSRSFAMAVSRLAQYNHYLEQMSSRLSHELRTPIAVVRTSLENLTMQPIGEHASAYIERAQTGVERLNLLLTQMSEATRIEQMLHSTDKVPFNIYKVLNGCISGYQQIYPDYELEYCCYDLNSNRQAPKELTATLVGAPEHIAQLLDKVVTNAIEFTNNKKVQLCVYQGLDNIQVSILNNGPLLPEQMTERLFDSMVSIRSQVNEYHSNTGPHLGLGLYIARLICEFHQGSISAKNLYSPEGVNLTILLPLTPKKPK
jgi:dedicated sortase system histidine kinase